MDHIELVAAVRHIQLEFTAWPSVTVSLRQARRLRDLPAHACERARSLLVNKRFLEQINGLFLRRGLGRLRHEPAPVKEAAHDASSSESAEPSAVDDPQPTTDKPSTIVARKPAPPASA